MNTQYETCDRCGSTTFVKRAKGPHIGLYCAQCDGWQKWIKQELKTKEIGDYREIIEQPKPCLQPEEYEQKETSPYDGDYDDGIPPWEE